jgi:Dna[CI] antecedent, DciA
MSDRPWYQRPRRLKRPKSRPLPVGGILDNLFRRHNLTRDLWIYEIQRCWPSLVGDTTARRCWPVSLQKGVLVVHVADSTWVQELTYLKAQLLKKVQTAVTPEAVTALRFYVRAGASSPPPEPPLDPSAEGAPNEDPTARPLAPNVAAALDAFENDLDEVEDPDLRRSIRRAFVEHLLRQ